MVDILEKAGHLLIFPLFSWLTLPSCTQPAPPSGFLDQPARMAKSETSPFQRSWKEPLVDFTIFREINIASVSTKDTRIRGSKLAKWQSADGNKMLESEVAFNAQALRNAYLHSFKTLYPNRWKIVPSPNTLQLELHLVEIVPSQPLVETAGFFIRGARLMNRPSIAIEGRFRDPRSGKIIMTFADRSTGDIAFLDLSKLQSYALHQKVMRQWARETVMAVTIAKGTQVPQPSPLKFITW